MRRFLLFGFSLTLLLVASAELSRAQTDNISKIRNLNRQAIDLSLEGKLDEAISRLEEASKLARNTPDPNSAIANANLAILLRKRYGTLQERVRSETDQHSRVKIAEDSTRDLYRAVELLGSSVQSSEKVTIRKDLTGLWKTELAWLRTQIFFRSPSLFNNKRLIKERKTAIVSGFKGAITDLESSIGENAALTLTALLNLAEFHQFELEFEEAFPLLCRFIERGSNNKSVGEAAMLRALRSLAAIYAVVGDSAEVDRLMRRVQEISGKPEPPIVATDLSRRSEDFAPVQITLAMGNDRLADNPSVAWSGLVNRPDALHNPTGRNTIRIESILVKVVVDELGKVIEAKADSGNAKSDRNAELAVTNWRFRPLVLNGSIRKMHGNVIYQRPL